MAIATPGRPHTVWPRALCSHLYKRRLYCQSACSHSTHVLHLEITHPKRNYIHTIWSASTESCGRRCWSWLSSPSTWHSPTTGSVKDTCIMAMDMEVPARLVVDHLEVQRNRCIHQLYNTLVVCLHVVILSVTVIMCIYLHKLLCGWSCIYWNAVVWCLWCMDSRCLMSFSTSCIFSYLLYS